MLQQSGGISVPLAAFLTGVVAGISMVLLDPITKSGRFAVTHRIANGVHVEGNLRNFMTALHDFD